MTCLLIWILSRRYLKKLYRSGFYGPDLDIMRYFAFTIIWQLLKDWRYQNPGLLVLVFLCIISIPATVIAGQLVSVTIQGIDGRLYDNVAASLKLNVKKNDESLSEGQIRRLHTSADKEIREALEPFGYYSPEISQSLEYADGIWAATYTVAPGLPVKIAAVEIQLTEEHDVPLSFQSMKENFPLKAGDQLDHTLYKSGKKDLLQKLFSQGYVKAVYAVNQIEVNRRDKSAKIILKIDTGPRYLFGKTVFEQDILDEDFLRRFINFQEGTPYSVRKLMRLQQILYSSNFFSQVVVRGDIDRADGLYIPITVRLTNPEFFNRYTLGAGYATDSGLRGKVGWDNRLINRYGHTVSTEMNIAEREDNIKFVYRIPVNDPRFDKMLFGATYNREIWDDTDTDLLQGGISYEHAGRIFKYGGGFEVRKEKYEVGVTSGESYLTVPFLNWSVAYGDDYINTSNGLFFSANLKGASDKVLADTTFLQGLVNGKVITTPFDGLRLIGRFSIGATAVDSIDNLPPSLRFYAGGDQSVRGYGYKELGPMDASGTVVGGQYLLFGSIEAEKRIYENWSAALFFDTGNGLDSFTGDLAEGVGVGIRYRLPFGQIRVDVASALSEDGNPLRLHITVGGDL